MIKQLEIKGYRPFKSLKLSDLSLLNLFGGKNNTGKTSILEALLLFYDRGNPDVIIHQLSLRNVQASALEAESLWAPLFYRYDLNAMIEMAVLDDHDEEERVAIRHNPDFYRQISSSLAISEKESRKILDRKAYAAESLDFRYHKGGAETGETHLIIGRNSLDMQIDHLRKPTRKVAFIGSHASRDPNEDAIRFGQLDVTGQVDDIVRMLRIIEPRLKSLTSVPQGHISLIHGDIGLGRKIPVQYMGEGTARLLSIILSIASAQNGLLLIDEIENGFHYSVMPKVWTAIHETAGKHKCQIMATTHSYEALKYFVEGVDPRHQNAFTYIRLDHQGDMIMPKIYSAEMLASAIDNEYRMH